MGRRNPPPLLLPRFAGHNILGLWAFGLLGGIGTSLALGTWGNHSITGLGWVAAFFNSAMSLSGMGPADGMPDDAAKVVAEVYAMLAGLAWTALLSAVLYPCVHRILHAFQLELRGKAE